MDKPLITVRSGPEGKWADEQDLLAEGMDAIAAAIRAAGADFKRVGPFRPSDFILNIYSGDPRERQNPLPYGEIELWAYDLRGSTLVYLDRMYESSTFISDEYRAALLDLFRKHLHRRTNVAVDDWMLSTEVLIRELSVLLEQGHALVKELNRFYEDSDIAKARVDVLELMLKALQEEHGRTKKKTDPGIIVALVMGISAIIAPIAGKVADRALQAPVADVQRATDQVQADCLNVSGGNNTIIVGSANVQDQPDVVSGEADITLEPATSQGEGTVQPPQSTP